MKIIIVDDSKDYREGLRFYLNKLGGYEIIEEFEDGEALLNYTGIYKADIILMDMVMPKVDGFTASKELILKYPMIQIIAITMFNEETYLVDLIQSGLKGCVFKFNVFNELPKALATIQDGKLYFPDEILLKRKDAG